MDLREAKITVMMEERIPMGEKMMASDVAYGISDVSSGEIVKLAMAESQFEAYELVVREEGEQLIMHEIEHKDTTNLGELFTEKTWR